MSAYLLCLSINGGIPLFTRKHGDLKSVPFALLASLNGVAMFGLSHDVTLLNTLTRECRIQWRDYHNSIRLIIVVPLDSVSDFHIHRLLDLIFQSMVLLSGLDDLIALRNIDRVKRELRSAFPLIDHILSGLQPSEKTVLFGDIIGGADVVVASEAGAVQNHLEHFTEAVDSTYGAVFVSGRIVTATSNWWSLHTDELGLLSAFIWSESEVSLSDTPVFLPVKSPTVPFRLVTSRLTGEVQVAVLCGPQPSLPDIQPLLGKYWKGAGHLLQPLHNYLPRCIPASLQLDRSILALIVVNTVKKRILSIMSPHFGNQTAREARSFPLALSRRLDILRTFYRYTVGAVLPSSAEPSPHTAEIGGSLIPDHTPHTTLLHQVSETFLCSEYHKCYAVQSGPYQVFCLYIGAVPNHSARAITGRTLQTLLKDKHSIIK